MIGDVLSTHQEFEQKHDDEADAARGYERLRRAQWIRRHGSPDGYKPARSFPCFGVLRVFNESSGVQAIACDQCGFEISMRLTSTPASAATTKEEW